jgi:hypothetical protein
VGTGVRVLVGIVVGEDVGVADGVIVNETVGVLIEVAVAAGMEVDTEFTAGVVAVSGNPATQLVSNRNSSPINVLQLTSMN